MKILLTGLPATGKTYLGQYLSNHKGYMHFNVEDPAHGQNYIRLLHDFVARPGEDKVVTWGFYPGQADPHIRHLQSKGYRLFWLDAPRPLIRKHFERRGKVSLDLLDKQLCRIDAMDLWSFRPAAIVDPYGLDGEFLDSEELVARILSIPNGQQVLGS
jgi:hypothetical protein